MADLKKVFDVEAESVTRHALQEIAFYTKRVEPAAHAFVDAINRNTGLRASYVAGVDGVYLTGSRISYFDEKGVRYGSDGRWLFNIKFSDAGNGKEIGSSILQLDANTPENAVGEHGGFVSLANENDLQRLIDFHVRDAARHSVAKYQNAKFSGAIKGPYGG